MFFGINDLWTYVIGAFLIILLPGPNSLLVLATAARGGVRQGYRAAAGVFAGDTVLMVLSAAGVASLLKSNPALFAIVKYAGAGYLAWIGLQMLRSAWRAWRAPVTEVVTGPATPADLADAPGRPLGAAGARGEGGDPFRRALTISLLNPKAILFFVSFFIQFVDPGYGAPALSFLILGAICQLFSVAYLSVLIFGGTYLATQFRRRRRLSAGMTSTVGALFLGFGAKLATATLG